MWDRQRDERKTMQEYENVSTCYWFPRSYTLGGKCSSRCFWHARHLPVWSNELFHEQKRTFEEVKHRWTNCEVKSIRIMVKSLGMNTKQTRFKSEFSTEWLCDLGQDTCFSSPTLSLFIYKTRKRSVPVSDGYSKDKFGQCRQTRCDRSQAAAGHKFKLRFLTVAALWIEWMRAEIISNAVNNIKSGKVDSCMPLPDEEP